jgi:hypothetical protein
MYVQWTPKLLAMHKQYLNKYKQYNYRDNLKIPTWEILYIINVSMEPTKIITFLIQNTFNQNQGFIIIGTPHLVLSATTSGKDNRVFSCNVWQG